MVRRYMELVPERPKLSNLERWFGEISSRAPFKEHCGGIPLT
jgi:glutathione S-transferase